MPPEKFAQQYEAEFLGVPPEPCSACGGPREDALGEITAPEGQYKDDFIPRCPSCGMFVDEAGRCIVKKRNVWCASFEVDRPWTERGSLAMYRWDAPQGDCRWV